MDSELDNQMDSQTDSEMDGETRGDNQEAEPALNFLFEVWEWPFQSPLPGGVLIFDPLYPHCGPRNLPSMRFIMFCHEPLHFLQNCWAQRKRDLVCPLSRK